MFTYTATFDAGEHDGLSVEAQTSYGALQKVIEFLNTAQWAIDDGVVDVEVVNDDDPDDRIEKPVYIPS